MAEVFSNSTPTTLSAGITSIQTTISVNDASTYPLTGNFRITVQQFDASGNTAISKAEIMIVTAVAGNTFTVTRGAESTTALAFPSGTRVVHICTAAVMTALVSGGGGVISLQSETGAITLTSSTLVISTPSGSTINLESSAGGGNVNTTGSPANGNLTKFSGGTTITNGDLSGDITTSGTLATTLATVNSNTGSFGSSTSIPNFTVNGKGLITAAGSNVVIAPAGTLTGNTLAANVVTSSLTTVGTITTGTWNGSVIAPAQGGTGLATLTAHSVLLGEGTSNVAFATIGTSGRLLIDQGAGADPSFNAVSGDGTMANSGAITITKTNGTSFSALATTTAGTGVATWIATPSFSNLNSALTGDSAAGLAATQTLTNKRITKRVSALSAGSATPAINTDTTDVVHITAQSAAITSFTSNLTGTPVDGDSLRISVTDDGTARALTFGTSFEASTVALPTTTVISARLDMGFFYNTVTSKWRIVALA
jgi:hypothetical protein